jgi:hypothetical protein
MDLTPNFEPMPNVKPLINVGGLFDIPTGDFVIGENGESILLGGVGFLTGVVGIGNNFKTTIAEFFAFMILARLKKTTGSKYDTEINATEERVRKIASRIDEFEGEDILETRRWVITDKTVYLADAWWKMLKDWLNMKKKNFSKLVRTTPFLDRNKKPLKIITPTVSLIDSFTEFETSDVNDIRNDNELGNSGSNTQHMRQGLAKTTFLIETPAIMGSSFNYLIMTAHIGKEINMGGDKAPPTVKLKHLKNGDKLKGVTDKFTFMTHNCWHCYNTAPFINDATKGPEYPRDKDDDLKGDTDLNIVYVRNLRAKTGATGMVMEILVSQSEGVLPSLTEFHFIKSNDKYGIMGIDAKGQESKNTNHYFLEILPEVKISRTTVRGKLDNDPKLRRAMNITSEMCQMSNLWHHLEDLLCTPKQLYDDLKAMGYDWDILLNTRGWWTLDNDHPLPFLSSMDLLRMRKGLYHPYWYPVKKENLAANKETGKPVDLLAEARQVMKDAIEKAKAPDIATMPL